MASACSAALVSSETPLRQVSRREVGGKAWNLFRLRRLGLPVPRFLVVGSSLFDETVATRRDEIRSLLLGQDARDHEALAAASRRIGEWILECAWPRSLASELEQALDATFGRAPLLAVRSSAALEDSAEHSFAGLLDSLLNVPREEVAAAIRRVWASAFSERALLYRMRKRLDLGDVTTAAIVQEMVQSQAAGVLFTRDPVDLSARCVVSAGYGLGEGVVADAVATDSYRIDRNSDRIAREVCSKDTRIVLDAGRGGGTRAEAVPAALRQQPVLSDAQLRQLCAAGVQAELAFGSPQDVEWAMDASARLFILQARPIVRARREQHPPARRVWDNSNIVESYPGLTLPLTFTFVKNAYARTFRRAALGFLREGSLPRPQVFANLVGLLEGRVYYNLLNWYEMFSYLPAADRHKDAWDRMIGISEKAATPATAASRLTRAGAAVAALKVLLRPRAVARNFFARFECFYARCRQAAAAAETPEDIAAVYRSLEEEVAGFWHLTIYNDLCAIRYHEWLTALVRRHGLLRHPGLQNALLSGAKGVESVAPVRSLVALAEAVRADPLASALFLSGDDAAAWRAIRGDPAHRSLLARIDEHLEAFGDRGLEELKLETPSFREQPERLIALIRRSAEHGQSVAAMEQNEQRARQEAEAVLARHALGPLARAFFRFVLAQARFAVRTRENMRFSRSRLFGIVRGLFRRLGGLLAESGLLESGSDVYFLTLDEALGIVEGAAATQDLKALVRVRKAEYERFARRDPGERLETAGIPYLGPLAPAKPPERGGRDLCGVGCSPGRAIGAARLVTDPQRAAGSRDAILVAKSTDPGWVFLMMASAGIVVEKGSLLSHTAIIGRELGIPTVVGVKGATEIIPDGAAIAIDGTTGEVRWV